MNETQNNLDPHRLYDAPYERVLHQGFPQYLYKGASRGLFVGFTLGSACSVFGIIAIVVDGFQLQLLLQCLFGALLFTIMVTGLITTFSAVIYGICFARQWIKMKIKN